ncbi:MAG: tripartite tricarboxylate transporter TctB family protein [Acidobacteria bacterium]|nr:tripartite tricarboxylate transporter TctB family protein [Acidobacteriota bacterium]
MNRDLALGGATLAIAIAYYLLSAQIPESQLADAVGPQGLPRVYAYILGALSLALIGSAIRGSGLGARDSKEPSNPESRVPSPGLKILRPLGVVAIGVIYIVVVPWLGYIVSLAGLIAATTYYQGGGFSRRVVIVALSGALLFWGLFVAILGIQHPAGIWPSLF